MLLSLLGACTSSLFEPIGTNLSDPISIEVNPATNRAYVVNSNINYNYTGGSLLVLDISDPEAPVILSHSSNPALTKSSSGQIYFNAATQRAYIANRESGNRDDTADQILEVVLDETAGDFLTFIEYASGLDPFALACCDLSGRLYVVSSGTGLVSRYDLTALGTPTELSLDVTLTVQGEASAISGKAANEIALLGNQAFISAGGLVYVLQLSEVGVSGASPIDYVIGEFTEDGTDHLGTAQGIAAATDASGNPWVYVVHSSSVDGTNQLLFLNMVSLPVIAPDTSSISQVEVTGLITATLTLGNNPSELTLFDSDGDGFMDRGYVANTGDDTITVVDLIGQAVVTTISLNSGSFVADEPFGLEAFRHSNGSSYLYVTNLKSNNISIINLATHEVIETFP